MIEGLAPYLWIALAAVLLLVVGFKLVFGRGGPRDERGRRMFRVRPVRRLVGLLMVSLALCAALLAVSLVQFLRLTTDVPIMTVSIAEIAPQRFMAATRTEAGETREYALAGDQWQVDARMVRWRLPALLAGVPPMYRLDRLSGRYADVEQERSQPRTVHALDDGEVPDIGQLKRKFPNWLPFVDVIFGSGAFMPMFDQAQYQVFADPRGALFVRPANEATATALKSRGW